MSSEETKQEEVVEQPEAPAEVVAPQSGAEAVKATEATEEKPAEAEEVKVEESTEEKAESLAEEAPAEEPVEESKEEPVEEATEAPAEEVVEAPAEEVVEEAPEEKPAEDLKEQLSVIKEVREELAKSYTETRDLNITNEQLSKDLEKANKTIESLKSDLGAIKARDEEAEQLAYNKKLENLSKDFKELGQDKSVESLSKMDKNVVAELEAITKIALDNKQSEQLDAETVPTEAVEEETPEVAKEEKPEEAKPEQMSNKDFMKGLCETLSTQQDSVSKDAKKIIIM